MSGQPPFLQTLAHQEPNGGDSLLLNATTKNAPHSEFLSWAFQLAQSSTKGLLASQYILTAVALTPLILVFSPNSIFRRALYPVQLFCLFAALLAPLPRNGTQADLYNFGLFVGTWAARIVDRVYMHTPEKKFLRAGIDDKPGQGPETYGVGGKAKWATELMLAARGVGWNWQVVGAPQKASQRRITFILNRVSKTLLTFALIHGVSLLSSAILQAGDSPDTTTTTSKLLLHPLFLRFSVTAGWLTVVYGHVTLPENLLAIFLVTTGVWGRFSDPRQWPPMFGDVGESYTLRRCWGKFWHASLRRSTNAPGEWLVHRFPKHLQRPKSRLARLSKRYGLMLMAFAVSGLIHAAGSYMVTRDSPQGISDGGATIYFLAQPLAILVEDAILFTSGVADDGKPSQLRRTVGYMYVAAFWLWCFPDLKVVPLARAHGLDDGQGKPIMAAVRACLDLAEALPFNPAKSALNYYLAQ